MFLGIYNLPLAVTMIGMLLGIATAFLATTGQYHLAIICLMYAGIADLFDGLVARKLKVSGKASEFGVQIDSLVDVVNFAIAPMWFVTQVVGLNLATYIVGSIYVFSILMRLAWFNISGTESVAGKRYYTGLPCTYAALILPLVFGLATLLQHQDILSPANSGRLLLSSLLIMAFCFLSKFKVPKPGGVFYVVFPIIAILLTLYFTMWMPA